VRYAISDKPFEWLGLSGGEDLTQVAQEGDWRIYQIADPQPRAFMVFDAAIMQDDEAARQGLAAGDIPYSQMAVVDKAVDCALSAIGEKPTVKILKDTTNIVEISASSDHAGILILADSYDPNWTVSVDGSPVGLLRVDTALRGVCVPAGEHRIRFEYQPRAFYIGVMVSMIGWVLVGIMALSALLRSGFVRYPKVIK